MTPTVTKKNPPVNWNALKWNDLIDVTTLHFGDPPATKHLTDEEIQSMISTGFKADIANLPTHSQSMECSVKLVFDAAHTVFGYDNRHRSIITKLISRQHRPVFISKGLAVL